MNQFRLLRRGAVRLATALLALAACRADQVNTTEPVVSSTAVTPVSRQASVSDFPSLDVCNATLPTAGNGDAVLQSTGCSFPDSVWIRVTASGLTTVAPNPQFSCCFTNVTYPYNGTYGPMGGGLSSNWMVMQVRAQLRYNDGTRSGVANAGSLYGFPRGSTASTVPIMQTFSIRKGGGTVWVERYGARAGNASINQYVASGDQTIKVEYAARNLQLIVAPSGELYEGDTVTFTAQSIESATIRIRSWVWQDSTGTNFGVFCLPGSSARSCRFVPPRGGVMTVRARVGSNPYYEQASVAVTPLPLGLRVWISADSTPATAGTVVSFTASSFPVRREVKQFSIGQSSALDDVICSGDTFCDALAQTSDSVRFTALVNGRPKSLTVYLGVIPCIMPYGGTATAACTDPDRWDVFLNSLTAAQRAAVLSLNAQERSACRQDRVACRDWAQRTESGQGGSYPIPGDSATFAEIAALTDSVYAELQLLSANWDGALTAIRAEPSLPGTRARVSAVPPTPDNIVDLIVVLIDLGEIAVAGPNAARLRGLALDVAATLVPGVPAPGSVAVGGKVTRAVARNLKAWHAAAKVGRERHTAFSLALRGQSQIGAARIRVLEGNGIGYIDGAIIDEIRKVITIIELKPLGAAAKRLGDAQLAKYKAGLESMERWVTNGKDLHIRDMIQNQGWQIKTHLERYTP